MEIENEIINMSDKIEKLENRLNQLISITISFIEYTNKEFIKKSVLMNL